MSLFSLVKHSKCVFHNSRMISTSIGAASGGWGRSDITAKHNVMHNYSMYVNFGIPKDYSGNISILFDCTEPTFEPSLEKTKNNHTKEDEIKIINDAPISYYTYS